MFYIGCHLSVEGGYEAMGRRAISIGANTFQFSRKIPEEDQRAKPRIPKMLTLSADL